VFGVAYQSFFILIVMWVVAPFRSFGHASAGLTDVRHLVSYPDTLVGSSEHGTMVALAALAFIFYVLSFLGFYIREIIKMPEQSTKSEEDRLRILRGRRFIFLRFRPERWYWGGVLLFRNFCFACVSFIPPEETFAQLLWMFVVLQCYLYIQLRAWPWHSSDLNTVDATQTISILGMVACAFVLSGLPADQATRDTASMAVVTFWAIGAVYMLVWISNGVMNYLMADKSSAKVKGEMEKVANCLAGLERVAQYVQAADSGALFAILRDMDIADINTANMVLGVLDVSVRTRAPELAKGASDSAKTQKRLSVFDRGITSPGRSEHIHSKKHGSTSTNGDPAV